MKKYFSFIAVLLFATIANIACTHNDAAAGNSHVDVFDTVAIKKIIQEKNNQFTKAHISGDHAVIDSMFTEDARSFPPNADAVIGRKAIETLTAEYIKYGINEFTEQTTALYGNKDYLVDEGSYFLSYGKDSTVEKGKYLNVWKNINGQWKIYSNMWNTNTPPAQAK